MKIAHRLFWLYVLLVLYLCLYPWNFQPQPVQPMWSWRLPQGRTLFVDAILNVMLFLPLGLAGAVAIGRNWRAGAVLGFAAIVSATVEALQAYLPSRDSSAWDLVYNTAGTGIGIAMGMLVKPLMLPSAVSRSCLKVDFRAALLLAFFIAAQLFPFIPRVRLPHLRASIQALLELPDLLTLLTAFITFLVVSYLMQRLAENLWPTGAVALVLLLLLVLRPLFPGGVHTGSAIVAAACGAFAGEVIPRQILKRWLGVALLSYLAFRQLYPFSLVAVAKPIYWLPFDSILQLNTENGVRILFEKCFAYGSTVWMLASSQGQFFRAIAATAVLLFAGEIAQRWIEGRTPDTLDPIIAIIMGVFLMALRGSHSGTSTNTGALAEARSSSGSALA